MNLSSIIITVLGSAALSGCTTGSPETMGNLHQELNPESFYLPNSESSRMVSVATNGVASANIVVQTHRVAVNETGPKETVAAFGEVMRFRRTFSRSIGRNPRESVFGISSPMIITTSC